MKISTTLRRSAASFLLAAGLAYPACAAVCPKGIGGCTSPGRCFLFTDADGNALCDYTARSGSSSPATTPPAQADPTAPVSTQVTTVHTTTSVSETTVPVIQNPPNGGLLESLNLSAPLAGAFIFLAMTGILFALFRAGIFGTRLRDTRPAVALSAFIGLGGSLISTCILSGGTLPGTTCALIFMAAGTPLAAYLWHSGVMNRKIAAGMAALAALEGFVFLAPIMPMELGGIVNVLTGTTALSAGVLIIFAIIALTVIVGRTFCGAVCPVGSLQELAYSVPIRKILIRRPEVPELIRLIVFVAAIIAAVRYIDLMSFTGLYDLFALTFSASMLVAAGLVLASVFVYRPVCRVLCPFGVLFSAFAEFSRFRLHRTENCINCRKCEKACPAGTAGKVDSKRECYLCGRCTDACKVKGALEYSRWHKGTVDSLAISSVGPEPEKTAETIGNR